MFSYELNALTCVQIQKLAKDSQIRRARNQNSEQRTIRVHALEVSKNSTVMPPAPPPLPAEPLHKPMEPTNAPQIQPKSLPYSNISNKNDPPLSLLLNEQAENDTTRPKEPTDTTLKDKADELHILKKSYEPSNANMFNIEPAQEAMEIVSQLQRHSEPMGTGSETSYVRNFSSFRHFT